MTKSIITKIIIVLIVGLLSSIAQAGGKCKNLSFISGGLIPVNDCSSIWTTLLASKKFPDIFDQNKLIPLCFVSNGNVLAKIGDTNVTISTISAWTSEFFPTLMGGPDGLGSVITQWTIQSINDTSIKGVIYTRDVIDMATSSEQDVVVAGKGSFDSVQGTIRVDSTTSASFSVSINNLSGTICY
jgi:hypothetical protein